LIQKRGDRDEAAEKKHAWLEPEPVNADGSPKIVCPAETGSRRSSNWAPCKTEAQYKWRLRVHGKSKEEEQELSDHEKQEKTKTSKCPESASVARERPPISGKESGIMDGRSTLYIWNSDRSEIT
jgi:hypothetical protein